MGPIVCCDRERAEGGDAWAAIGAALSGTAQPPRIEPDLRPERRRLWQLRDKHHCVLLGAAVEGANGVFLYHDGGVEDHLSRLPTLLRSADAVVCLAGDVSHCAYYAVKRYCKRFGKACALLGNSSVSALAQGLHELA
jgi:hypothetical protein